ncbi:hypothetical protein A6R70_13365 [Agrobacterium rubi]|uniref:hypothetical protein n=1 Tax=Agrobacterium rubi TaxID=28099 RepID=UPI0005EB8294|nr:hypothetical protein [Agrobacterium rubi]MBP1879519.1 hypothetical protein [Agrobacterium rubi]MCL6653275.1 hypothetical protein [Agrobacterium rubi]
MNRKSNISFCVATVALMSITAAVSVLNGNGSGLVLQKILVAPMFLLASESLHIYFPARREQKWSLARQAQFEFMNGALLGTFFVLAISKEVGNAWNVALNFGIFTSVYAITKIVWFIYRRKGHQQTN